MRKAILGAAALAALLFTGPAAFAKDPCLANCDGGGVSSATANQLQGQQQTLVNQNNVRVNGGAGGQGGQGGLGGQGGVANSSSSVGNIKVVNAPSTTYQASAYAPDALATPPGLAGSIGFGVCATQDSRSGGGGVGIGVLAGPSIGVSGSYGATTTNENLQCDLGRSVEAYCKMNPNFHVDRKHTAGQICGKLMTKMTGAQEAILEIDHDEQVAAKQDATTRSATGWGHCDRDGKCYNGLGQRTN